MANNRMYLTCNHPDCKKKGDGVMLAKFYPGAWYVSNPEKLGEWVDEFLNAHRHGYDESGFGGWQYGIAYEVVGDGSTVAEQVFSAIEAATPQQEDK